MIVDSQNKLQKASGAFGSARSLIQNGARQSHNLNQDFNKCKKDMLNQREMTVQATQAQIDGLNAAIQAKIDQQNDISKGLNLAQTQKASRDQENAQSKQQKQQERTFTQQNMTQNLQTKTQNTQEKVANLQTQLNEANEKKNKASGRIALLGTEPAGEKSPQEAVETVGEYDGARRACYAACEPVGMENSCVNLDIDKEKVSNTKKADGTATTTSPSPSPTGGNTGGTMTEGNK